MPKFQKMRGGWQDATPQKDLIAFYDRYTEKRMDPSILVTAQSQIPSGPDVTNSLMVIDMQNDFVKSHPEGAFSVADGIQMADRLADWIRDNNTKFTKIIFTRDNHDPAHCSFLAEGGIFPPHCTINSEGAALYERFATDFKDLPNAAVIFKGQNPTVDSFGAYTYPSDVYGLGRQKGAKCCKPSASAFDKTGNLEPSCADATGGFYLKDSSKAFDTAPFTGTTYEEIKGQLGPKFAIKDLYGSGKPKEHNVFVVGLAGDFCVRDTARNIALATKGQEGPKVNVFVIQPFTRYAFVPLSVGGVTKEQLQSVTEGKPLNQYVFKVDFITGMKTILTKEEAAAGKFDMGDPSYQHFLTEPAEISDTYVEAGVKLIMFEPTFSELSGISTNLFSGGRRKRRSTHKRRPRRRRATRHRK
jgi:nicotinamidase-related amidase